MEGQKGAIDRHVAGGNHLLDVRRPAEAIKAFEQALSLEPENAFVLCCLARAFLMLGEFGRTLDYAKKAIAADPDEEWSYRLLAYGHLGRSQGKLAYRAATRSVELEPESDSCLTTLAHCAYALGRLHETQMLGETVVRQHPESTSGHTILGDVARRRGDRATASKHYERVLRLDPEDDHVMHALAELHSAGNEYGDSVALLHGAINVDPSSTGRQDGLRESMAQFALFGQAHERRRSVAGLLASIFFVYLILCPVLGWLSRRSDVVWEIYAHGLLLFLLVAVPGLKARFLAAQSGHLLTLHRNINRKRRKRILQITAAALVAAHGLATMVYLDVGDPEVFLFPLRGLTMCAWLYVLAVTMRLATLWLSDGWVRLVHRADDADGRRIPAAMILLPAITAVALAIMLTNGDPFAMVVFVTGLLVSAALFFSRFPVPTGVFITVAGAALVVFDLQTRAPGTALTLGQLGILIGAVGFLVVLWQALRHVRRTWERRRIGRLLTP